MQPSAAAIPLRAHDVITDDTRERARRAAVAIMREHYGADALATRDGQMQAARWTEIIAASFAGGGAHAA